MTTQRRVRAVLVAAGLGLLASGGAAAQDRVNEGLYFGVFGGTATFDFPNREDLDALFIPILDAALAAEGLSNVGATSSVDDSDVAWGLQVGYRFNDYVAAEVGYVNLGEVEYEAIVTASDGVTPPFPVETSLRFNTTGPTASVLGMFAINDRFDIHGRAGILFADTRLRQRIRTVGADTNFSHAEFDGSTQDLFAGVGAAWNINDSFSLRFEYMRFFDAGDDETSGEFDIDFITLGILFR
jgi:OmpA-OmpF porin, OOP family